ncbi:MAG TPA: LamG domain-containing protein [Thermoplasmatales archaeon]|nr:LamG domain-containing protein [Thermoplasmatales archaeon]
MRCEGFRRILVFGVVVCFFGAGVTPNMLTRTVKADLTTGLVGYWSFDNELDPLNDDSNNGHDASNHGGTWVDNGVSGGAFQFDDDSDYIDVPDHSDFDFGTGSFTLCCWVKTTKQDYMYILDKDPQGVGNPAFFVRMNKLYPNELTFVTGSTGNPDDRLTTTESFTNGDWHFLVFKRDSSESKKYIYFDGQLSASAAAPMYDVSNSEPLLIVSWNFQGIVDEVRVYNRALSASEIQQLYNQGGGGNQPPTEGLVGYWSFDEGSGSIAHDYSGNGNDGTIYGASWDTDGSSGNCLYFDGDGDYVDVGYVTSSNIKTFNIWVKPDSTITKNTGSPGPGNTLHLATFSLGQNFALGNSTVLVQDETITLCWNKKPNRRTCVINLPITPSWHMITCVWNLEEERYDVYFDGIKQSVSSGTVTHVPLFSANDFEINRDNSRYNGKIDEVRIYDRVLSESEIQQLYNQGGGGNQPPTEGLVGYWSFDEGSGSIAHDYSGNGNDGTIYGASWTTDTPSGNGYALSFDGINDYVDCGNDVSLNPENEITLAAWYKPVSFAGCGNSPIIDKGYYTNTDPYYQYHLGVTGDNYHQPPSYAYAAFLFHISADDTLYGVPTPDGFWTAGNWYHIAGTYDGSTVKLYVNGDLIDSVPASGTMQDYGKNVYFGRFTNKNAYTPGIIDEISIYNRALSASEIQQLYNQGGGGNQPPEVSFLYPTGNERAIGEGLNILFWRQMILMEKSRK